jgi:putative transposase
MKTLSSKRSVAKMCKLFGASRSGYYNWLKEKSSKREQGNAELLKAIKKSHQDSNRTYGIDKILRDVRETMPCSRGRVYRLMKKHGIRSVRKRPFKPTTNSNHKLPVAENLLNQNFQVDAPNKVWVSDITYVQTGEGWLYLATVKDLFHKGIVGWAASHTMTRELVMTALTNAVNRYRPSEGLIHHSDRGVQYCSHDFQNLLKKHQMRCSMSRKGNCYDNASAESFFGTIKVEMIYQNKFETRKQAWRAIFEYIEMFYNRKRRHQALNYLSPEQFLKQHHERKKTELKQAS